MSDSRYFASGVEFASERERLALLESYRDPRTFELLGRFNVREGWRCLDVGAGGGSVARWLAKRVGSTGRVVAVDIDTRFIEALDLSNVESRQHDILADAPEAAQFDLVHCRSLLLHLPEPRRALDNMMLALRPGGWLLVEDVDYTSFGSAMREHPLADTFDRTLRAGFELMLNAGLMDIYFGRRLPSLFADLDLTDVGHEGPTNVHWGGTPEAAFWQQSFALVRELVAKQGLSEEDLLAVVRAFDDPSFTFVGATNFAAWGRRRN